MGESLGNLIQEKKAELDRLTLSCSNLTCDHIVKKSQELDVLIVEWQRQEALKEAV